MTGHQGIDLDRLRELADADRTRDLTEREADELVGLYAQWVDHSALLSTARS